MRESHVPTRGQVSTAARQQQQQQKIKDGGINSTSALALNLQKKKCVYCLSENHTSEACEKLTGYEDRRKLLMRFARCFNCLNAGHRAGNCRSKSGCRDCAKKHHVSTCSRMFLSHRSTK